MAVDFSVSIRRVPVVDGHRANDGRAFQYGYILGFSSMGMPGANESSPMVAYHIESS